MVSNAKNICHRFFLTALIICTTLSISLFSSVAHSKTTSVVTFNSEYGLILIDSIHSRAPFDLFESLNVPVQNGFSYQTKIFAPPDKSFRIACTAYGASHVCAVIVYPGIYANLNFDTDEISLDLPGKIAKTYANKFPKGKTSFKFQTEDKRLIINWSKSGLSIKNFRFKNDHQRPRTKKKYKKPSSPDIEL